MVERKLLVDELELEYEGLFNATEVYAVIDEWLKLKGYDKFEALNQEQVLPTGKDIRVIITPKKWHTDYVRKVLKIELIMQNVKEVETVVDHVKVKMNQGEVRILFSGILETDWEGRWEQRPIYFFLRTIFEKYIYRTQVDSYESEVVADVQELKEKVGSYLNLYRFRKQI